FLAGDLAHQVDRRLDVGVGEAQQDAVVAGVDLRLDAEPLADRPRQDDAPRPVDAAAQRRVDHHPRIADRVPEQLDDEGAGRRDGLVATVIDDLEDRAAVESTLVAKEGDERLQARRRSAAAPEPLHLLLAYSRQSLDHPLPELADAAS